MIIFLPIWHPKQRAPPLASSYLNQFSHQHPLHGHLLHIARIPHPLHWRIAAGQALSQVMEGEGYGAATHFHSRDLWPLGDPRTHRQRRPPKRHHLWFLRLPQTHVRGLLPPPFPFLNESVGATLSILFKVPRLWFQLLLIIVLG